MKALIESKGHRIRLEKEKNSRFIKVDEQQEVLQKYVKAEAKVSAARVYYAASKISALVRGFLDRIVARKERKYFRAIRLIQKVIKGKLGRIRWKREYWRSISVVKSDEALKDILERSKMLREKAKLGRFAYHWQEYFDPLTNSFWYYNRTTRQNTWEVPLCFQESLICTWNGYQAFGALTTSQPCRAVFKHVAEYHNHLRTAHKWICVACFQSNTGMDFPECSLCGNHFSEDGTDGEKEMKKAAKEVHEAVKTFLEKDLNVQNTGVYRIRDRMIEIAKEQRQVMEQMLAAHAIESNTSDDESSVGSTRDQPTQSRRRRRESMTHTTNMRRQSMLVNVLSEVYFDRKGSTASNKQPPTGNGETNNSSSTLKLPPIPTSSSSSKPTTATPQRPPSSNTAAGDKKTGGVGGIKGTVVLPTGGMPTDIKDTLAPMDTGFQSCKVCIPSSAQDALEAVAMVPYASKTTRRIFDNKAWITSGGLAGEVERYRDPLDDGQLTWDDFDMATTAHDHALLQRKRLQRILLMQQQLHGQANDGTEELIRFLHEQNIDGDDLDSDDDDDVGDGSGSRGARSAAASMISKKAASVKSKLSGSHGGGGEDDKSDAQGPLPKMLVCPRFIEGTCTLTTCPMAHPGLRDSAQIYYKIKRLTPKDSLAAVTPSGPSAAPTNDKIRIPYVFVCADHTSYLDDHHHHHHNNGRDDNDDGQHSVGSITMDESSTALQSFHTGETAIRGLRTGCPRHIHCPNYHMYIRPSTQEIIRRIYPLSNGIKEKQFYHNRAHLKGFVKNNVFQGYGQMHWSTGAVYLGDWVGEQRQGFGIYRSKDGDEYVGQFHGGKKHGWGIFSSANGEQYIGQWVEGKMHGVGMLRHMNGDVYQGQFSQGQYEGIGYFQRSTGDCYLGYHHRNFAEGLGIESRFHRTVDGHSEKYKGYFERNARHGRGCCYYRFHKNPDGAQYAIYMGSWYRGVCEGSGIFQVSNGDRYVGQWAAGKKEGLGRYTFGANGDFYDGEFHRDRAHGMGIYYHSNGNMYKGQWADDMRNGRGTYNFANGSKYTGHWSDNRIHVKGKFDFANGAHYRGEFSFNVKQGKGIYTWANGTVYKGQFFAEKLCGWGEIQYINGHRYVGQWDENRKNGRGTFYYRNDSAIYEGDFRDDLRHGKGRLMLLPGTPLQETYEGDWAWDQWHGHGKYTYTFAPVKPLADQLEVQRLRQQRAAREEEQRELQAEEAQVRAKKLAASFAMAEREKALNHTGKKKATGGGSGKASSKGSDNASVASGGSNSVASAVARVTEAVTRGTTPQRPTSTPGNGGLVAGDLGGVTVWYYEGEWQHNVRVGHGLLYFTDHSYYRGEFQRDQFWGKGVYVHPLSQTQYEGMWRANMRHGMGTSLEPDGSIYTGEYFSNMKQGEGKLMRPDGSVYLGTWDANTIVGMGRVQIPVGDPLKKDGLKKVISCKVFGY